MNATPDEPELTASEARLEPAFMHNNTQQINGTATLANAVERQVRQILDRPFDLTRDNAKYRWFRILLIVYESLISLADHAKFIGITKEEFLSRAEEAYGADIDFDEDEEES